MQIQSLKSMKNLPKTIPKCLLGSVKIHLEGDMIHQKVLRNLKDAFTGPQPDHFGLTWNRFVRLFYPFQIALPSIPSQISFAKLSSTFVGRGSLFKSSHPTSELNLDITDRHLDCIV